MVCACGFRTSCRFEYRSQWDVAIYGNGEVHVLFPRYHNVKFLSCFLVISFVASIHRSCNERGVGFF